MKQKIFAVLIIIVGISAIAFIWSDWPARLFFLLPSESKPTTVGSSSDETVEQPIHFFPLTRTESDLTRVTGSGFELQVPIAWSLDGIEGIASDISENDFGMMSLNASSTKSYFTDDEIVIDVSRFEKPNLSLKEIAQRSAITDETQNETDVKISEPVKQTGKYPVYLIGSKCVSGCDPEGPAMTNITFFVDAGKDVYQFYVRTTVSNQTDAQLKEVEKIVQSLKVDK